VAVKILKRLAHEGPLRHRDLWKLAVQDSASVSQSRTVMYWLRNHGFIRKVDPACYCAPYEITEKGKQFLAALL